MASRTSYTSDWVMSFIFLYKVIPYHFQLNILFNWIPPYTLLQNKSPDFLYNSDEICSLISHVSIDTTSGFDGISSTMLHDTASCISLPLSLIFNSSLSTGIFLLDWKNSNIVPIHKLKTSPSSPSDYHPISLLFLLSKILDHHIFNCLYDFSSTCNILANCLFGFQPGFSTKTALLSIVNSWFSSLDLRKAVYVVKSSLVCPKDLFSCLSYLSFT